jgi:hypothetical protein
LTQKIPHLPSNDLPSALAKKKNNDNIFVVAFFVAAKRKKRRLKGRSLP